MKNKNYSVKGVVSPIFQFVFRYLVEMSVKSSFAGENAVVISIPIDNLTGVQAKWLKKVNIKYLN